MVPQIVSDCVTGVLGFCAKSLSLFGRWRGYGYFVVRQNASDYMKNHVGDLCVCQLGF